jgi:hypothetical protein
LEVEIKSAIVIQERATMMIHVFTGRRERDEKISLIISMREKKNIRELRAAKEREDCTNTAALKTITKGSKPRKVHS